MTVEMPGTRPWLRTIKAEFIAPALPASKGIPLGGLLHKQVIDPRIKPGSRAYRAKLRTEAGLSILQIIAGEISPLSITTPADGATVPPVHDVAGTGAIPGADVELWHVEIEEQVATVAPDGEGNWAFTGDTPADPTPALTWQVRQGPRVSPPVTITVEDPEAPPLRSGDDPEDAPWESMTMHVQLDQFLADEMIEPPVGWEEMKIVDKKAWLNQNY